MDDKFQSNVLDDKLSMNAIKCFNFYSHNFILYLDMKVL